jgi:uncharacterized repeat protein (TIGR03803 family)
MKEYAVKVMGFLLVLASSWQAQGATRQFLPSHLPAAAARSRMLDAMPATNRLDFSIALPLRNREGLTNLLKEIYDPASPSYHHYLTPQEFAERFGPSQTDCDAVAAFLAVNGLRVTSTHPNRVLLEVEGGIRDIEKTFQIRLNRYQHPAEARTFFAPNTAPSLELSVPVLGVDGLDDYVRPQPANLKAQPLEARANSTPVATGSGPVGTFIGRDFRGAYAPGVALDGSGQAVGLLELDGYNLNDVLAYEYLSGAAHVPLTNVLIDGATGSAGNNNVEVALDIEMALAMAPNLSQILVYQGRSRTLNNLFNRMATDNLAKQLSSSWSFPSSASVDATRDQIFLQYAAQGQSMFQSSGDSGGWTGKVDPPCDNPNLTVVGGTGLTTTGPGGNWVSETTWDGSGGGVSTAYTIPTWQKNLNLPTNQASATMRSLPDVSALADVTIWIVANNGQQFRVGGTSASAPLWAGFTALINQQAAAASQPWAGFLNPALYALGQNTNYGACLHDITTGSNTSFYAANGFDLCTGWGSPKGSNLIAALLSAPDTLQISPATNLAGSGTAGGPFTPSAWTWLLTNSGASALNWTLTCPAPWLTFTSTNGTLNPGGGAASIAATLTPAAFTLTNGTYTTTLAITNLSSGFSLFRSITLTVYPAVAVTPPEVAFTTLHSFAGIANGAHPNGLMLASDGNFYGTTQHGGASNTGTLFKLSATGTFSSLHSFSGSSDGAIPSSALAQGLDGNLYGTAFIAGTNGYGTLFKCTLAGTFTNVFSFDYPAGMLPYAAPVAGADGSLYGTTSQGGTVGSYGSGTVYRVAPDGTISTLYAFSGGADGGQLFSELTPGADGRLYGTAYGGGAKSLGVLYAITTNGALTTLAALTNSVGSFPYGGIVQDADESWYGVATAGGASSNGAVFRLPPAGSPTNFYSFSGGLDGATPMGSLLHSRGGNFYGTTSRGGAFGHGTLFQLSPAGTLTTLVHFSGSNGATPQAALIEDTNGTLYGTARDGGLYGSGTLFRVTVGTTPQITANPASQSVYSGTNVLLAVAASGPQPLFFHWRKNGTNLTDGGNLTGASARVLSLTNVTVADSGAYSVTVSNSFGQTTSLDAILQVTASAPIILAQPASQSLAPGSTAVFSVTAVGTTPLWFQWRWNGTNLTDSASVAGARTATLSLTNILEPNNGAYSVEISNLLGSIVSTDAVLTVVPASVTGTRFSTVHYFTDGLDGSGANGLVQGANSNLYGTTQFGGTASAGTLFRLTPDGTFDTLASLDWASGAFPAAPMVLGADGSLYGTATYGGAHNNGTLFRWTPGGILTNLHSFAGPDGANPTAALVQHTNGSFFGLAENGGAYDAGSIFRLTPDGSFAALYAFPGGTNGGYPIAALAQGNDGNLYGTTESGGAFGAGSVFRFTTAGAMTTLASFNSVNGSDPVASVVQGADGNFYGTTKHNTLQNFPFYGTVFKLATNGTLTSLYAFNGFYHDGFFPCAPLIQGADGNLYGTTYAGGANGYGAVFKITSGGTMTTLLSLDSSDTGAYPEAGLVAASDGSFYGTTSSGGVNGYGTVFKLSFAPQVVSFPTNQDIFAGASFTLAPKLFGSQPLSCQWRLNGTNLADSASVQGSTNTTLRLMSITSAHAGTYSLAVSNFLGTATGSVVLSVVQPPLFQTVRATNGTITLTWTAAPGHTYQLQARSDLLGSAWTNVGSAITATNSTLTVQEASPSSPQRFYRTMVVY